MAKSGPAKKSRLPQWVHEMLAELIGTYFLIMMGDAAIANYHLNRDSKQGLDLFAVAFTFGIAGMIGLAASAPISGGHLNPAVTLAFASIGRFPLRKVAHYFLGQYLGSFLAAATVFIVYYEGIAAFDHDTRVPFYLPEVYGNASYANIATGGIFSTYPAPWMSVLGTLVDQIVATFGLVFAAIVITAPESGLPSYLHPFMLGMVICGMVVAFGLQCGAALNPARDFAPRLFQLVAGYGIESFKPLNCLYWLTAGIVGPHVGGILGAWAHGWLLHHNKGIDDEDTSDGTTMNEFNKLAKNDPDGKPFLVQTKA